MARIRETNLATPTNAFDLSRPNLSLQIWSMLASRPNVCSIATNDLISRNRRDRFFTDKIASGWTVLSLEGLARSGDRGSRNEWAGGVGCINEVRAPKSKSRDDAIQLFNRSVSYNKNQNIPASEGTEFCKAPKHVFPKLTSPRVISLMLLLIM